MKRYKAVLSVPTNKPWLATKEERTVEAPNMNKFIIDVMTVEEIKSGVRVIELYEKIDGDYYGGWKKLI